MQAEVPGADWVPADRTNYRSRPPGPAYTVIVIHITSGHRDPYPVAQMFQQPNAGKSIHFIVGQSAELLQCVPLAYAAYHAHTANSYSVGIEHCAREPNEPSFPAGDPGLPPTEAQYQKSAWLVAYLCTAAGMVPTHGVNVIGHNKADPQTTHTGCPDAAPWDWLHYMDLVNQAYAALNPPAIV